MATSILHNFPSLRNLTNELFSRDRYLNDAKICAKVVGL